MGTNLFERQPVPGSGPGPAAPESTTIRRMLGIRIALELSGAPALDAAGYLLLTHYVAGRVALADILPSLEVG